MQQLSLVQMNNSNNNDFDQNLSSAQIIESLLITFLDNSNILFFTYIIYLFLLC